MILAIPLQFSVGRHGCLSISSVLRMYGLGLVVRGARSGLSNSSGK